MVLLMVLRAFIIKKQYENGVITLANASLSRVLPRLLHLLRILCRAITFRQTPLQMDKEYKKKIQKNECVITQTN